MLKQALLLAFVLLSLIHSREYYLLSTIQPLVHSTKLQMGRRIIITGELPLSARTAAPPRVAQKLIRTLARSQARRAPQARRQSGRRW